MNGIALDLGAVVGGFLLLGKGADWLVAGGSELARRWGVSPLVVGLSVVAWGTSAPEVVVSALAAADGRPSISMGNVLGSNLANIGLVLGSCAVVLAAVLQRGLAFRESFWLLAALGALWLAARDRAIDRTDGVILLGTFAVYNLHLVLTARRSIAHQAGEAHSQRPWTHLLLGFVSVALGAELAVSGAVGLATFAGVSERVIGLTIVAIGTSLPELAAGIGAAFKREAQLSVGNVVGSNVFNVLAVIGVVGIVAPFDGTQPATRVALDHALEYDFPIVLVFSLAAIAFPYVGGPRGGRWKGTILLAMYCGYTAWLFA